MRANHKLICGDAGDFKNYTNLPDCVTLLGGPPCQPFATHGPNLGR